MTGSDNMSHKNRLEGILPDIHTFLIIIESISILIVSIMGLYNIAFRLLGIQQISIALISISQVKKHWKRDSLSARANSVLYILLCFLSVSIAIYLLFIWPDRFYK